FLILCFFFQAEDGIRDFHVTGVQTCALPISKQMVKQGGGGKIINIASMLSYQGGIRVPSYTASKSAVMGLTRILANELAPHGIRSEERRVGKECRCRWTPNQ